MESTNPICITGMHRAGTSMVAHLLHECGIYLGEEADLLSASDENADGYWEHGKILELNNALLAALGGSWSAPPQADFSAALIDAHRAEALQIAGRLQTAPLWGWKDPRTTLTLPFWQALFPDLKRVICLRSPVEVARSLNRRKDPVSYDQGLHLWHDYYERLLNSGPMIITHYETFFYDAPAELKRILDLLGVAVSAETIQASSQFVSKNLRHHSSTRQQLEAIGVPAPTLDLYAALCEQAGPVYATMMADTAYQAEISANYVAALEQDLIATERRVSEVRHDFSAMEDTARDLHHELHRTQIALDAREHELQLTQEKLAFREQQLMTMRKNPAFRLYMRLVKPMLRLVRGGNNNEFPE